MVGSSFQILGQIKQSLKIEKLQEKALRYSMLDFKSPYQQLLYNCGKSTLFLQRLQKLMEVIYRILNGLYPSYLNDIITVEEIQHLRCKLGSWYHGLVLCATGLCSNALAFAN